MPGSGLQVLCTDAGCPGNSTVNTSKLFFVYTDFCFCFSVCALLLQWQWFGCFRLGAIPGVGDVHVIVSLTCSNTSTCVQRGIEIVLKVGEKNT